MIRQVDERSRTPRSAARLSKSGRWASRGALRGQQNTRHTRRGAWCTQKRSGVALMVPRGTAGDVQQSTAAHTGGAGLQSRAQRPRGAPSGRGARAVEGDVERACPDSARAHCGCSRLDGHARWGDVCAVERRARHSGAVVLPAACRTLPCTRARCTHVSRSALHRLWRRASQPLSRTYHASTCAASFPQRTSTSVTMADRPRRVHTRHPILAIYCFIRLLIKRDP